jgi:hypothetical protein
VSDDQPGADDTGAGEPHAGEPHAGEPHAAEPDAGEPDPGVPEGPAAGWYPDPDVHGGQRFWDGSRWTEDRRTPAPVPQASPPAASPWGTPGSSWGPAAAPAAPIDTWLWQSIVATIFCCQPFGIVAIVFSAMAGSARDAGNWEVARQRADQARTWTLVSVGTVLILVVGFALFAALAAVLSA